MAAKSSPTRSYRRKRTDIGIRNGILEAREHYSGFRHRHLGSHGQLKHPGQTTTFLSRGVTGHCGMARVCCYGDGLTESYGMIRNGRAIMTFCKAAGRTAQAGIFGS